MRISSPRFGGRVVQTEKGVEGGGKLVFALSGCLGMCLHLSITACTTVLRPNNFDDFGEIKIEHYLLHELKSSLSLS